MTLFSILLHALVHDGGRGSHGPAGRAKRRTSRPGGRVKVRIVVMTSMIALIPACSAVRPVDIDTRTDTCSRCRMPIDGLAHAGQMITADGDVRKYDSLGCLVGDYRDMTSADHEIAGTWVIDYASKQWLKAQDATYAMADLPTDHMGFGAAAASTPQGALKIARGDRAKVVTWQELLARR